MSEQPKAVQETIKLLDRHYNDFYDMVDVARQTGHPVPMDTRGWSQILVSVLTGLSGLARKKGADLEDGSDVKAANTWEAIDTPRFNGVIKSGTKSATSDSLGSLDGMPYLFLVMWDHTEAKQERCRIWCVRPQEDKEFRDMCKAWYEGRISGEIASTNFQLHPPRGKDGNIIRNSYGNLEYPLLFCAVRGEQGYEARAYDPNVLKAGLCSKGDGSDAVVVLAANDPVDLLAALSED